MEGLRVADAITEVFALFRRCNKYIDETTPWVLAKGNGFLCGLLFSELCSKVNGCFYGLGLVLATFGTGHKGHIH